VFGKKHDKKLADQQRYRFPPGSKLWKDTGYQGYEPEGVITYQLEFCDEVEAVGEKWCKMVIPNDRRDDHAPTHCSISSHCR
jgi:hypothetical protein